MLRVKGIGFVFENMSFENTFKSELEKMIPKDYDDYTELKYSDTFYIHVWSHYNGEGSFEIEVMVPHDQVDTSLVDRDSDAQLSPEISGVEKLYSDIEQYIEDVSGNQYDIVFYLQEVVDDGAWERDASSYSTHELTV